MLQSERGYPPVQTAMAENPPTMEEIRPMDTSSSNIKGFPESNPRKKVICIGGQPPAMVVLIHDSIVKQLHIDEQCWFEEIPVSNGIFLKFSKNEMPT